MTYNNYSQSLILMTPQKWASFFMDIKVIPTVETEREDISLRSLRDKPKPKPIEYEAEKVELSKNIQRFEKKVKVYTENPYSYNAVALKKEKPSVMPTASADQMITSPIYNTIGKFLGVDTVHDWNQYYDKVYTITEWAKLKSGHKDIGRLTQWISNKSRSVPSVGNKNIDNLYLFARLALQK